METKLYNQDGEHIGVIRLNDYIFGIEPNRSVMHQAMVRQLANARYGTHNTRGRGDVRGSTRKLYRQKGTGRARQGAIRAPHRRGGGVAHGPHPRSYEKDMPRKMRRLAVRSALSVKQAIEKIRFVDDLDFEFPRTKDMIEVLEAQGCDGKTLIVLEEKSENVYLSAGNLPYVKTLLAHYLNVVDLLSYDHIIMSVGAVQTVDGYLGDGRTSTVMIYSAEERAAMGTPAAPAEAADEDSEDADAPDNAAAADADEETP